MKYLWFFFIVICTGFATSQSLYDVTAKTKNISNFNKSFTYIFEDFEDSLYPPRYWKFPTSITRWSKASVSAYNQGQYSLKYAFFGSFVGSDSIILPAFINNNCVLKFDYAHSPGLRSNDKLRIDFSGNNGVTYDSSYLMQESNGELNTAPYEQGPFTPDSSQWKTKIISLPNNTNKIRFCVLNNNGNNLYLDNIQIGEISNKDVGIYNIDINKFILPGEFIPKYTVKNYGKDTVSFNVKIKIGNYESQTTVGNLLPNTKKQIFGDPVNIAPGNYLTTATTYLVNDQNSGNDTLSFSFYAINSEWQQGDTMPFHSSMSACSSVMMDDTGYVIISGGHAPNNVFNQAAIYNVNSNTWRSLPAMPEKKIALASAVAGNYYYAIGGARSSYDSLNSSKVFALNLKTKTWENRADMPIGLAMHRAVSYQDSLIYVLGGDHGYVDNHRIFLYNADNDSWRELDSFQLPSLAGALTIFKNKIIYVGGADSHSAYSTTYIGNIQLDHSIIWHRGTDYPLGTRFRWNAAPWGEKGIIVLNGCRTDFWNSENECYLYNPDNDTWHIMPPKNFNTCGTSITSLKINNKMKLFALGGYILNDITNYNEILVDSITVPVELTSFASTISKNSVTIKWATATEKNNYGFEIERKDLKTEFKRIGFIKGKGTTTEVNNYSYSDNNLAPNAYNYRIKQIDYDGNYKYYYLANEVNLQYTLTYSLAQNYPNPFNPGTTIKYAIAKAGVVTLKLYDILGKEKAVLVNERKEPGNYVYAFKNNNLSSGIYFYTLKVNDYAQTKKMIILK